MNLKIYLVDIDQYTGQITPNTIMECIKKNNIKKINAIILMYQGGYPQNVKKFYDIKKKYNFSIIEDACHALGAEYIHRNKSFKVGSCNHSDISTFSMHPLKTITSGEGGIITTNNSKIAKNIKLYRSHGIQRNKKKYWNYDVVKHGYNYRLSDINCALGLSQLKKINFFIKKRKKIYENYVKELENFNKYLKIPKYNKNIRPSYHLFLININFAYMGRKKDHFFKYLISNNIFPQQHYVPIYKFSIHKRRNINFPGSEKYFENTVSLPIFVSLNLKVQKRVINKIKYYFDYNRLLKNKKV